MPLHAAPSSINHHNMNKSNHINKHDNNHKTNGDYIKTSIDYSSTSTSSSSSPSPSLSPSSSSSSSSSPTVLLQRSSSSSSSPSLSPSSSSSSSSLTVFSQHSSSSSSSPSHSSSSSSSPTVLLQRSSSSSSSPSPSPSSSSPTVFSQHSSSFILLVRVMAIVALLSFSLLLSFLESWSSLRPQNEYYQIVDVGFLLTYRLYELLCHDFLLACVCALVNTLFVVSVYVLAIYVGIQECRWGLLINGLMAFVLRLVCGFATQLPFPTQYLSNPFDFPDILHLGTNMHVVKQHMYGNQQEHSALIELQRVDFYFFYSGHCLLGTMACIHIWKRYQQSKSSSSSSSSSSLSSFSWFSSPWLFIITLSLHVFQILRLLSSRGHYTIDLIIGGLFGIVVEHYHVATQTALYSRTNAWQFLSTQRAVHQYLTHTLTHTQQQHTPCTSTSSLDTCTASSVPSASFASLFPSFSLVFRPFATLHAKEWSYSLSFMPSPYAYLPSLPFKTALTTPYQHLSESLTPWNYYTSRLYELLQQPDERQAPPVQQDHVHVSNNQQQTAAQLQHQHAPPSSSNHSKMKQRKSKHIVNNRLNTVQQ